LNHAVFTKFKIKVEIRIKSDFEFHRQWRSTQNRATYVLTNTGLFHHEQIAGTDSTHKSLKNSEHLKYS